MKKIALLFLLISNTMFAVEDRITLTMESMPLKEILNAIEEVSSYYFIYNQRFLDDNQPFSISVYEETIFKTLEKLFKNTSITFLIRSPHIILKDRSKTPPSTSDKKKKYKNTIQGKIMDHFSGEPLIGATVVDNKKNYNITDKEGYYLLENTSNTTHLSVSHIGYEKEKIILNPNGSKIQNFFLKTKSSKLNEVQVVLKQNLQSKVGSHETVSVIKGKDISNTPSFFGISDANAVLRGLPGVNSNGTGTSGFNIRGGNSDQNLILLDNSPIYEPSHLFGLFSLFNPSTLKSIHLYKGNTPARLGGRASSVLEVNVKDGNKNKLMLEGSLGPLVSHLQVEGPIKKEKIGFLIAARRTYFDFLSSLLNNKSNFYFYDITGKIHMKMDKKNTLLLSTFTGVDSYKTGEKWNIIPFDFNSNQHATSLEWNHVLSKRIAIKYSAFYTNNKVYIKTNKNPSVSSLELQDLGLNTAIKTVGSKATMTFTVKKNNTIRMGFDFLNYNFKPHGLFSIQLKPQNTFQISEKATQSSLYTEWEKKWPKLSFNFGLRWTRFNNTTSQNNKTIQKESRVRSFSNFEPRISLNFLLNERTSLNTNYNRMFQYIHMISNATTLLPLNVWKPSGYGIQPIEVNQWAFGIAHDIKFKQISINMHLEGYYKSLKNMVSFKNNTSLIINQNQQNDLIIENGHAYGIEFNNDFNIKSWKGNLNYTYSRSFRKIIASYSDKINEEQNNYPSNYDRPHVLNISIHKWLSKRLKVNTFFTFQSGQPTSLPTEILNGTEKYSFDYTFRNKYRLAATHRLDLSVNFYPKTKPNKKWHSYWSIGAYNIYGQKNPISAYMGINDNSPNLMTRYQFSPFGEMIPFISYNFNF